MDKESLELGLLLETAQTHQKLAEALIEKLKGEIQGLGAVVRDEVRHALCEELAALEHNANNAAAALERMKRAANLRVTLWTVGLTTIAAAIAIFVAWLVLPTPAEIAKLGAERDELQGAINLLASHGGRADLKTCGMGDAHLCIRVEPRLGKYGDEKDYFVIKGY